MQPQYIVVWVETSEDGPSYRSKVLANRESLSEFIDYLRYDYDCSIYEIYEVDKIPDYAKVHIF